MPRPIPFHFIYRCWTLLLILTTPEEPTTDQNLRQYVEVGSRADDYDQDQHNGVISRNFEAIQCKISDIVS